MRDRTVDLLARAKAAARTGRKAKARRIFEDVLRRTGDGRAAVTALLWLAWLADDPARSVAYAERALARNPGDERAAQALSWAQRRLASAPPHRRAPATASATSRARPRRERMLTLIALCLLVALAGGGPAPGQPGGLAKAPSTDPATISPVATPMPMLAPTGTHTPVPTWTPMWTPTPVPARGHTPKPASPMTTATTATPGSDATLLPATLSPDSVHGDLHWVDVNLTSQALCAYEGRRLVRTTPVSTGLPRTPTPVGLFRVQTKLRYDDMSGSDYTLPNVPYVMYFHKGYALHGTYWHARFGEPASHGCVNIPTEHAEWLFGWAEVGTLVSIHY